MLQARGNGDEWRGEWHEVRCELRHRDERCPSDGEQVKAMSMRVMGTKAMIDLLETKKN
jgi:hypothetical protein